MGQIQNKYHLTNDGMIFSVLSDGSVKEIGNVEQILKGNEKKMNKWLYISIIFLIGFCASIMTNFKLYNKSNPHTLSNRLDSINILQKRIDSLQAINASYSNSDQNNNEQIELLQSENRKLKFQIANYQNQKDEINKLKSENQRLKSQVKGLVNQVISSDEVQTHEKRPTSRKAIMPAAEGVVKMK